MALQPRIIACGTKMAAVGMVIRFVCGPLIMSAASIAVGLRGIRLHAAIVQVIIVMLNTLQMKIKSGLINGDCKLK